MLRAAWSTTPITSPAAFAVVVTPLPAAAVNISSAKVVNSGVVVRSKVWPERCAFIAAAYIANEANATLSIPLTLPFAKLSAEQWAPCEKTGCNARLVSDPGDFTPHP